MRSKTFMSKINLQRGKLTVENRKSREKNRKSRDHMGHMQVCTSLQTDNHASTPPLSFLQAGCPSCCPTNNVKALKGYYYH